MTNLLVAVGALSAASLAINIALGVVVVRTRREFWLSIGETRALYALWGRGGPPK
jgi:hypothetical protein